MPFITGRIDILFAFYNVQKLILTQEIDNMANSVKGLQPGHSGTFHVNPVDDKGGIVPMPPGVVPVWSSSDPILTIISAMDGMSATIGMASTASPGASVNVTVMAILPDNSTPTTGAVPIPILQITIVALELVQD